MVWAALIVLGPLGGIVNDPTHGLATLTSGAGSLQLRLSYRGGCTLDRLSVRGREVLAPSTRSYTGFRRGDRSTTSRDRQPSRIAFHGAQVAVEGIVLDGGEVRAEERWTFRVEPRSIVWRIERTTTQGGLLDDAMLPAFDFASRDTWAGALLGTGGVAWFRLFDTPLATYGVHASDATFWNPATNDALRISVSGGAAWRFSRNADGTLAAIVGAGPGWVPKYPHYLFLRDRQDVWAPQTARPGKVCVEVTLSALNYRRAYDRGVIKRFDGGAVREIGNTIARLGAVDRRVYGSNGWYSGYAVLHEQWIASLALAIHDPAYIRSYAETLDDQRKKAIGPDGRVKSRWAYFSGDAKPGTYDANGFYECQWGMLMDSQPDWVLNVAEQFDLSGDLPWVRRQKKACEMALDYLLRRDRNGNGLVEMATDSLRQHKASDWIDVVWASFESAFVNAEMYAALRQWADVEEVLGDGGQARRFRLAAKKLKASFNRTTEQGGFWDARRGLYVYWREPDGIVHGTNLVTPVNFMAIAYGLCDDPARRDAILDQIDACMAREKLFCWPLCVASFTQEEGGGWPFPSYENGDIFLGWAELGLRAYAPTRPATAVRVVDAVLRQYQKDGLAFQRYLRASQSGAGGDILANNANAIVGLYRDIYGVQPKYNRLVLDPHLTPELDGTVISFPLRRRVYRIALHPHRWSVGWGRWTLSGRWAFGMAASEGALRYFRGHDADPALEVSGRGGHVDVLQPDGRRWRETASADGLYRHRVLGLPPGTYEVLLDRKTWRSTRATSGGLEFAVRLDGGRALTIEVRGPLRKR